MTGLLVWAAAVPLLLREGRRRDVALVALAVALTAMVAVRDAGWVVALCLLAAGVTAAAAVTGARSAVAVLLAPCGLAAGVLRAVPWVRHGTGEMLGRRRARLLAWLRSLGVTVVLLIVFSVLFASADTVFADYLSRVDLGGIPVRAVVAAIVALTTAAFAHLVLAPPEWGGIALRRPQSIRRADWLLPVVALDALVLAFVLVQLSALHGGNQHVLQTAGLSYAEYAREGFGQLVVASCLLLLVVALAARRAPQSSTGDRTASRVALGLLCLGTLALVVSALTRLRLYVDAFGLTRTRLLVVVVEVALAVVVLLVLVAGVRWKGCWMPRAVVTVMALAILSLAAVNPDAVIARHNAGMQRQGVIDVAYLGGLSADAVPTLSQLDQEAALCAMLSGGPMRSSAGAGWNVGRARAVRALTAQSPLSC